MSAPRLRLTGSQTSRLQLLKACKYITVLWDNKCKASLRSRPSGGIPWVAKQSGLQASVQGLSWVIVMGWSKANGKCKMVSSAYVPWEQICMTINVCLKEVPKANQTKQGCLLHRKTGQCASVCCLQCPGGGRLLVCSEQSLQVPLSHGIQEC